MKKILCSALQYCSGGTVNISSNPVTKNLNGNVAEVTAPGHNQKSFAGYHSNTRLKVGLQSVSRSFSFVNI